MKDYIGTKQLKAEKMLLGAYNKYRGWELPKDEDPDREGYLVIYPADNQPNGKEYESWSPKEVFEASYRESGNMTFGHAIEMLKAGNKVARNGWNGKDMWLMFVPGTVNAKLRPGTPYAEALEVYSAPDKMVEQVHINAHIDMFTAQGTMQPGWLASQTDMLAEDWGIV